MSKVPQLIRREGRRKYTLHDQIIFFINGSQRYGAGVTHVFENKWTHLLTQDGQEIIVNPDKVLYVQRYIINPKTNK